MASKIVLPTKGATTGALRADMRLQPVRVMGSHVSLQVVGASESWRKRSIMWLSDEVANYVPRGHAAQRYFLRGSPL